MKEELKELAGQLRGEQSIARGFWSYYLMILAGTKKYARCNVSCFVFQARGTVMSAHGVAFSDSDFTNDAVWEPC